jgi:hypothetical protein
MNVAKLSASTRMALNNNFGFPKGENGTIGAFVKVSKNIDKELKDLGATIPSDWFGQATGELFTIRFPINSLDKISEIDGLVNLDIEQKLNMNPPRTNLEKDNDSLTKQYQNPKNQQNALNQQNNSTSKYIFKEDFEAIGSNMIDKNITYSRYEKLTHKFKKGDVFEGKLVPINAGVNPEAKAYNIEIITPNNFTEDGRFVMSNGIFQVPENVVSKQTFLEKNKTNLLIVGALVLGYLAYKKLNK